MTSISEVQVPLVAALHQRSNEEASAVTSNYEYSDLSSITDDDHDSRATTSTKNSNRIDNIIPTEENEPPLKPVSMSMEIDRIALIGLLKKKKSRMTIDDGKSSNVGTINVTGRRRSSMLRKSTSLDIMNELETCLFWNALTRSIGSEGSSERAQKLLYRPDLLTLHKDREMMELQENLFSFFVYICVSFFYVQLIMMTKEDEF